MGENSQCRGDGGGYRAEYAAALGSWLMHAQDALQPVLVLAWQGVQNATDKEFLTSWAEEQGAIVLHIDEFSFQEHLNAVNKTDGITGAFIRLDIPSFVEKHKLFDLPGVCGPEVLYTDSDVLFMNPVTREDLQVVKRGIRRDNATVIAYGPEFFLNAAATQNTGVMVMHVDRFRSEWPKMLQFALEQDKFPGHDQILMNTYFKRPNYEHMLVGIPVFWNWKTYWPVGPGMWPEIKVLHTHGPKSEKGLWRMAECDIDLGQEPKVNAVYQGLIAQGICCNRGVVANRVKDIFHAVLPELNVCQVQI